MCSPRHKYTHTHTIYIYILQFYDIVRPRVQKQITIDLYFFKSLKPEWRLMAL